MNALNTLINLALTPHFKIEVMIQSSSQHPEVLQAIHQNQASTIKTTMTQSTHVHFNHERTVSLID